MGSNSMLGLLFEISADPSQAESALARFETRTNTSLANASQGFQRMGASIPALRYSIRHIGEDTENSLGKAHQAARLLEATLGIRLPRAVTTAVADMIPAIGTLSTALVGVFAIEGAVKLVGWVEKLRDDFNDVAAAEEVMKSVAEDNVRLMEEGAKKSEAYARQQLKLVSAQVLADEAAAEALNQQESGAGQLNPILEAIVGSWYWITGHSKDYEDIVKRLPGEHKLLDSIVKILGEDETAAHEKSTKAAEKEEQAFEKALWARQDWLNQMTRDAANVEKQMTGMSRAEVGAAKIRESDLKAQLLLLGDLTVSGAVTHAQMTQLTPQIMAEANATVHLSAARKELIGITQSLRLVEDAFRNAIKGEMGGLESLTDTAAGIGAQFAGLIGGTKAVAAVKGAFDSAQSIEYMAQFIASWGTDTAALGASVQYGLAAAEMFKVAGGGGGSRGASGGGGGGSQSSYGRGGSNGGGSGGTGGASGGGAALPGGGTTIHVNLQGPGWTQSNVLELMDQMTQLTKSGQGYLVATNAWRSGPKQA